MKTILFFLSLIQVLIISCTPKNAEKLDQSTGNSIIIGSLEGYHPKFCDQVIQLIVNNVQKDDDEKYLARIDTAGNFIFNFQVDYPQETIIRYSSKSIAVLSFPEDTAKIKISIGNLNGYKPTVELMEVKSDMLKHGDLVNNLNQSFKKLEKKYQVGEITQGEFEPYFRLMNRLKTEQLNYIDSLKRSNSDIDSIVLIWAEERVHFGFISKAINYYSINRMLNRSASKKSPISEGLFEKPIDMNYQAICDSLLDNTQIDSFNHRPSSAYAYFLNNLDAYNSYQLTKKPNDDYFQSFPKYLKKKYSGDAYQLLYTRFLFKELRDIELHRNSESLAEFKHDFPKLLLPLEDERYSSFIEKEFTRVESILQNDKPIALKYNLAKYPETDNFWKEEVLNKNKHKVIYIKFWAPWCGPCMRNWPSANNLVNNYIGEDFELINLCIETNENDWNHAISKHRIIGDHYLLTRDQSSVLMSSIGVSGIPYNLLIDKNGVIRHFDAMTTGSADGSLNRSLVMQINNLLNE
jgi:thiol-disulfide isomerase/thioredoxin